MRLHGYSERGVVNAVFEVIACHPNGNEVLGDLLGRLVRWQNRERVHRFVDPNRRLVDFEIYIEPSLSDYGNPDVLVLATYEPSDRGKLQREAFFIEAKMEPFLVSSPPTAEEVEESRSGSPAQSADPAAPAGTALLGAIVLACDQLSVPAQDRVGRDDSSDFTEHLPAQCLAGFGWGWSWAAEQIRACADYPPGLLHHVQSPVLSTHISISLTPPHAFTRIRPHTELSIVTVLIVVVTTVRKTLQVAAARQAAIAAFTVTV